MKYGLIGEHLGHSFSKIIHESLDNYHYDLCEVAKEDIDTFMKKKDFIGINVTIPYKETVMPYLDDIDPSAKLIGCVNTIVNRDGKLFGTNTDYYGLKALCEKQNISFKNAIILILGSGGTAKTARKVATDLGAKTIITVSRNKTEDKNFITYEELEQFYNEEVIIINTTPLGMYPKVQNSPISLKNFKNIQLVVDVIYNPLRTTLLNEAISLNIPCCGGLYMLVLQAYYASMQFTGKKIELNKATKLYQNLEKQMQNLVLIGMPSSGKTTIGKELARILKRELVDTDDLVKEELGMRIDKYIQIFGETSFRKVESEVIEKVSLRQGIIISTGGGVITRKVNIENLKRNGQLLFINRPLELLTPTKNRPLSSNLEALKDRYEERLPLYKQYADKEVINDGEFINTINKILKEIDA